MPNAAIAGPRRMKQAPLPAPGGPQPSRGAPPAQQASRELPPLDYDEPTRMARRAPALVATMPVKRAQGARLLWFVLGIALGAMGAAFARGGAAATLHELRAWSARALRSLERTAPPPARAHPSTGAPSVKPIAMADAPCPVDPGPGDPCDAELLAPFADPPRPPVPTVSVDALPRVKPPVAIARRHHHVTPPPAPAATVADAPPADDDDDDDDDDVAPPRQQAPKPYDTASPDSAPNQFTTAENDPSPIR
jgi:hypothetical protein